MTGFVNVTSGDLDALKAAIAAHGPISVGIDASHRSLSFYANGVYYEPNCGKDIEALSILLLPRLQSAYRAQHSTETAVLKVLTDILLAVSIAVICLYSPCWTYQLHSTLLTTTSCLPV